MPRSKDKNTKLAKTLRCTQSILSVTREIDFFKTWKLSPWRACTDFVRNVQKRSIKPNKQEVSMVLRFFKDKKINNESDVLSLNEGKSMSSNDGAAVGEELVDEDENGHNNVQESLWDTIARKSSQQMHVDKDEELATECEGENNQDDYGRNIPDEPTVVETAITEQQYNKMHDPTLTNCTLFKSGLMDVSFKFNMEIS